MRSEDEIEVYRNPFCKATLHPKIPDGKCTSSIGQSNGCTMMSDILGDKLDTMVMIVYPGLNSCCKFIHSQNQLAQRVTVNKHVVHEITQETPGEGAQDTNITITNKSEYVQWRTVSAGVRLSCISGSNSAQGWWEAIALPMPEDERWFTWTQLQKTGDDITYSQFEPSNHWLTCGGGCNCSVDQTDTRWCDNEYYCCGKISDLNHTMFQCIPQDHDHPFIRLDDRQRVNLYQGKYLGDVTATDFANAATNNLVDPNGFSAADTTFEPSETLMDAIHKQWDRNFLCWVISFHLSSNTSRLNLLTHTMNNQELIAGCKGQLRRFHTESKSQKADVAHATTAIQKSKHPSDEIIAREPTKKTHHPRQPKDGGTKRKKDDGVGVADMIEDTLETAEEAIGLAEKAYKIGKVVAPFIL